MKILQLRNHIPIAGPARREAADGSESAMRVSLGFEPAWFHQRCGVDFSQRWHTDPYYRFETLKQMKAELARAFQDVSYWDLERTEDLATISGCYGAYPIAHAFGIPLRYAADRWPMLEDRKLSVQEIEELQVEQILHSPVVEDLWRQMDILERVWGQIHGYLNWQGVLNNAFNLRGQEIFLDMQDKPKFVHRFFTLITDVMMQFAQKIQERQRQSGFYINQLSVSNCVMNMISPRAYKKFVFPYDKRIAENFERFGVHTCNWNITPYINVLAELPKLGYLDMGMNSDMVRVKATFPDARRAVLYSPVKLQDASLGEIRADMEKIFRELAPCDVVMADIQSTTPDRRVNELLSICRDLESQKET